MRPKTPEEIAKNGPAMDQFNLYLEVSLMKYIKDRAKRAGTSASRVVNEAISMYVETLKKQNKE
jgi:hypothetical protein